jgi:putative hemolysin
MSRFEQQPRISRAHRRRLVAAVASLTALAGLAVIAGGAHAANAKHTKVITPATYCSLHGGTVQYRTPAYNTNGSTPIVLSGRFGVCMFQSKANGSRVYVDLNTIAATRPTLAALAYLEKPAMASGGAPSANPASLYCTRLGGTDSFGGVNAAGGGWLLKSDTKNPTLQACVFPDQSMIDSWALAYHATGAVRGTDLTNVFKYQSATPPSVFS